MWTPIVRLGTWLVSDGPWVKFYNDELRSDFFDGFLTLAAFMLAAKTFIVIHMKHEVYDKPEYESRFDERKELVGEQAARRYGPLEKMSNALYWITVSSVVAAILQITVGLLPCNICATACIIAAIVALWRLVAGLKLMKQNLDGWFAMVHESEARREKGLKTAEVRSTTTR